MGKKNRKKISAVILTQNNETTISVVLEQLTNFVDEIIVVDGGSHDNTINIVTAISKTQIFYRKFKGNFAEQRNYGIEQANGKWILMIDTDELLCKWSVSLIPWIVMLPVNYFKFPRAWLVQNNNDVNYICNKPYYPDYQLRLFRNKYQFRYQINGHNTHETFPKKGRGFGLKLFFLKIFHFDFLINDRLSREKKVARYINLDSLKSNIHNRYLWEDKSVTLCSKLKRLPEYSQKMYSQ